MHYVATLTSYGNSGMDVATTLHSTLFGVNLHCFKQLQNVGYLSTLHSPYIRPTFALHYKSMLSCQHKRTRLCVEEFWRTQQLLVWVLHKTLIFWLKGTHNGVVALMHYCLNVGGSLIHRIYWLMDGERQGMPFGEVPIASAGHHVERAIYR